MPDLPKSADASRHSVAAPASGPGLAEQMTEFLKGALQAARIAYLSVGQILAQFREAKLHEALGFADLESYAKERLQLSRSALYSYLRVYEWVRDHHPDWLNPGPGTFIPELNDVVDLMWMDKELGKEKLGKAARTRLEGLKEKALAGTLVKSELARYRGDSRNTADDGLKAFLARLRALRAAGAKLSRLPPEILEGLDNLIAMLHHAILAPVGPEGRETGKKAKVA